MKPGASDNKLPQMSVACPCASTRPFKCGPNHGGIALRAQYKACHRRGRAISGRRGIRTQFHHMTHIRADDPRSPPHPGSDDIEMERAKAPRRLSHGPTPSTRLIPTRRQNATRSISRCLCNRGIYHDGFVRCDDARRLRPVSWETPSCLKQGPQVGA